MQGSRDDRSIGELFADLTRQMSTLLRQEVQLAKVEMTEKASKAGRDVGSLAVGGAVAYAGFLAILAGLVILLAEIVPWWLSAMIVGLAVIVIGYVLIQRGLSSLKQEDLAPRQTIESLREDAEFAKEKVSS
jgi:xanthine/uracil permease